MPYIVGRDPESSGNINTDSSVALDVRCPYAIK